MGGTIEKITAAPFKALGIDPAGDAQDAADRQSAIIKASAEAQAAQARETARGAAMQQENAAARAKVEQEIADAKAPTSSADVEVVAAKRTSSTARKRAAYQSTATPAGNPIRI
jgi:hypothetical protein